MQRWRMTPDQAQLRFDLAKPRDVFNFLGSSEMIPDTKFTTTEHPKLKFNFTMDIDYRDNDPIGNRAPHLFDLPVKSFTRPAPTFTMVEVNYYNFRTKVATKTDWGTFTIVMYDDSPGVALGMYEAFMYEMSPSAQEQDNATIDKPHAEAFGNMSSLKNMNHRQGPIRAIQLHHHYIKSGVSEVTSYKYMNPKLVNAELDELNMSESDVATITLTFAYDGASTTSGVVNVGAVETVK